MLQTATFVTKEKTVWDKIIQQNRQNLSRNIFRQRAGPHRSTEILSFSDTFQKIMSMEMMYNIVRCINKKADAVYEEYNSKHPAIEPRV